MNPFATLTALTIAGTLLASAQNVQEEPRVDPVQDAIEAFTNRDKKPTEVVVILDPPAPEKPVEAPAPPQPAPQPAAEPAPVRVTGSAPPEAEVVAPTAPETPAAPEAPADQEVIPEEIPAKPSSELVVRVEKLQIGKGKIDPAEVKLNTPYPAKPLSATPAGWCLDTSESAPPFTREVEIAPGSKITLTISPHVMIPDADGAEVFTIAEPGYNHSLGYQQNATVGAILSNSVRQLDDDSKKLTNAIESLQQLLVSLPKPEPQPTEIATPAPGPAPTPATTRKK